MSSMNPGNLSALEETITSLLSDLSVETGGTEQYASILDQLVKLHKLKEIEETLRLKYIDSNNKQRETDSNCKLKDVETDVKARSLKLPFGVSPDTLAIIGANLIGIAILIGHEKANVITSKALGFVMKLK